MRGIPLDIHFESGRIKNRDRGVRGRAACRSGPDTACTPACPGGRGHWSDCDAPPIVKVAMIRADVERLPKSVGHVNKTLWLWLSGHGTPDFDRGFCPSRLPAPIRHRTRVPVPKRNARPDHPLLFHTRTGRPLDLARRRRLHPAPIIPRSRRRPPAPLGTPPRPRSPHPLPGPARVSATSYDPRHTSQPTEIPNPRPRTAQRHPHTSENPLLGGRKCRLSRR